MYWKITPNLDSICTDDCYHLQLTDSVARILIVVLSICNGDHAHQMRTKSGLFTYLLVKLILSHHSIISWGQLTPQTVLNDATVFIHKSLTLLNRRLMVLYFIMNIFNVQICKVCSYYKFRLLFANFFHAYIEFGWKFKSEVPLILEIPEYSSNTL